MEYVGIDLGKRSSQVCIGDAEGVVVLERRIQTRRVSLAKLFGEREKCRILIEASTESEWVARCLEELGHEVIVADPNFAPMYSTRTRKIKTDRRDARALSDACRLGAYRHAHRTSDEQRHVRAQLAVRENLVRTRTRYISVMRALVRREGYRIESGSAAGFCARVEEAALAPHLLEELEPLLRVMKSVNEEIKQADKRIAELGKSDEVVGRLRTVPGVGPVTAVAFVATLDSVERFENAKQVRAYLGLVPREYSSGERQLKGRITKAGNARARSLLVEAAWGLMRYRKPSARGLQMWAGRIAARRGKRIAAVALARKLAGILYAMWRDGTAFEALPAKEEATATATTAR